MLKLYPISLVKIGGMPWPATCETHYYAQLGLPEKSCAIKGFFVCFIVWEGHAQGAWVLSSVLVRKAI